MPRRGASLLAALLVAAATFGCHPHGVSAWFATRYAEPKTPEVSTTELAAHARAQFWEAFYDAEYERLERIHFLLTAAYLENPRDPEIALLLAHAHLWTLAERSRLEELSPRITDHAILADRYFNEALILAPDDSRIHGWQGAMKLALGDIHQDQREQREGYFQLVRAAREYPEFNGFSASYPLGSLPRDNPRFDEGVEYMWANVEACVGDGFDRNAPGFAIPVDQATAEGPKRVCWSTPLVPHNLEGFFLHMGDILTKQGDADGARRALEAAKRSPSYDTWRYAPVLDERLARLDERVARFASATREDEEPEMMFDSPYACTGCHAR